MRIKTEQEIEDMVEDLISIAEMENMSKVEAVEYFAMNAAKKMYKDLIESVSEGFSSWVYKYPDKCDLRDFKNPNHNYFVAEEAWQASRLSMMKTLEGKDKEIAELKQKLSEAEKSNAIMKKALELYAGSNKW